MNPPADEHVAVAIVGGGIPRHSNHPGYGVRDLRRFISGPAYARRLTATARVAGAVLQTSAMVTGWAGERTLEITSPAGRRRLQAGAVVLATGARERPRPARLIPGDRPDGVYTTGQLQNLVHLYHAEIGRRAVVIGAELVSWSAVLTLRAAEFYAAVRAAGRLAFGVPVATRTRVTRINGKSRVESVEIENLDRGSRRTVRPGPAVAARRRDPRPGRHADRRPATALDHPPDPAPRRPGPRPPPFPAVVRRLHPRPPHPGRPRRKSPYLPARALAGGARPGLPHPAVAAHESRGAARGGDHPYQPGGRPGRLTTGLRSDELVL